MSKKALWKICNAFMSKFLSEEHKKKIGDALRGKNRPPFSTKWKSNLSISHKGQHSSPATEFKKGQAPIAPFKKGNTPWNKDLKGYNSGDKSHFWNGGITSLVHQIRNCFEYRKWRFDIFCRDNFTCRGCGGEDSGNLNADHFPKSFAQILYENNIKTLNDAVNCEELWNISNGRTLCITCHQKTDNYLKPFKVLDFKENIFNGRGASL